VEGCYSERALFLTGDENPADDNVVVVDGSAGSSASLHVTTWPAWPCEVCCESRAIVPSTAQAAASVAVSSAPVTGGASSTAADSAAANRAAESAMLHDVVGQSVINGKG
jgi:hypothetical protein